MNRFKAITTTVLTFALGWAAVGCEGSPSVPSKEQEEKVIEVNAQTFLNLVMERRLNRILERDLEVALKEKKQGPVRRLCDLAQSSIEYWRTHGELSKEDEALVEQLNHRCGVEIAGAFLDQMIREIREAEGEDRRVRCDQAATPVLLFAKKHSGGALASKEQTLLELCPEVAKSFKRFEALKHKAEREEQKVKGQKP